jgi:hypothetical protein
MAKIFVTLRDASTSLYDPKSKLTMSHNDVEEVEESDAFIQQAINSRRLIKLDKDQVAEYLASKKDAEKVEEKKDAPVADDKKDAASGDVKDANKK